MKPAKPSTNARPETPTITAREVLRLRLPLLDVRAPAEYEQGHVPGAVNMPILNDAERHQVGITYKEAGNAAATELGHRLVSGANRQQRLQAWAEFATSHTDSCITCWRGGQRSQLTQKWLAAQGIHLPRVEGGYKALRHACLDILEQAAGATTSWYVLAGQTGTGKTVIINELATSIDLEGAANHRGSAFGAMTTPQPAPATFENALAYAWLEICGPLLVVEDESRTIGRLGVPLAWHARMQQAPLVLVQATLEQRVEHIFAEYVEQALANGATSDALAQRYREALSRIRRRLGGVLHAQLDQLLQDAFNGKCDHRRWIEALLTRYYDPMYDYQLSKKQQRIVFRGDKTAVVEYLNSLQT